MICMLTFDPKINHYYLQFKHHPKVIFSYFMPITLFSKGKSLWPEKDKIILYDHSEFGFERPSNFE